MFKKSLGSSQRALEALNCKIAITDVIWFDCNYFGWSETVGKAHENHQPIALTMAVRSGQHAQ